jgi:hypothetical protein
MYAENRNEEAMKKLVTVVLILLSAMAWAGTEPNPADYTINVHVTSSRMVLEGEANAFSQKLNVTINEKKYELRCSSVNALLALGDYKAKLVRNDHRTAYDSYQVYEFLFPDNKTRKFEVVGVME